MKEMDLIKQRIQDQSAKLSRDSSKFQNDSKIDVADNEDEFEIYHTELFGEDFEGVIDEHDPRPM